MKSFVIVLFVALLGLSACTTREVIVMPCGCDEITPGVPGKDGGGGGPG